MMSLRSVEYQSYMPHHLTPIHPQVVIIQESHLTQTCESPRASFFTYQE